ncbi:MAG: DUF308 domain-containing protein [Clostridia bacterium]|nr:DUF308 domain-containing protein [Clostridia bacterium]
MENLFKKFKQDLVLSSVGFIILGVVVIIFSRDVQLFAGYLVGGLMLFLGLRRIFDYVRAYSSSLPYSAMYLASGIVLSLLGLFVICTPFIVGKFIFALLGILTLINGVINLSQALEIKKNQQSGYLLPFIISIAIILVGCFITFHGNTATDVLIKILGVLFILIGISNLYTFLYLKRNVKAVSSQMEIEGTGKVHEDD